MDKVEADVVWSACSRRQGHGEAQTAYGGKEAVVGTLAKEDAAVAFESTRDVLSWSDYRADQAAAAAVNADKSINLRDWSNADLKGQNRYYIDDNRDLKEFENERQYTEEGTKNNKDYHP